MNCLVALLRGCFFRVFRCFEKLAIGVLVRGYFLDFVDGMVESCATYESTSRMKSFRQV